ncbi:hypothetical protein B0A64_12365 [Flavobacterium araucananum]|uniref:Uncharacterized protein n=1 Tax=Flavobacterium araucananum TaxID=946678 RepID=A0A227P6G4_9FLAO|nr:hypothetical protein B0A64_12365 [Flavobacterium araucananum]
MTEKISHKAAKFKHNIVISDKTFAPLLPITIGIARLKKGTKAKPTSSKFFIAQIFFNFENTKLHPLSMNFCLLNSSETFLK